jgi:hypothetical protein
MVPWHVLKNQIEWQLLWREIRRFYRAARYAAALSAGSGGTYAPTLKVAMVMSYARIRGAAFLP